VTTMSVAMMPWGGGGKCNASRRSTTQQSGGTDNSNKQQLVTAAVTAGDGSCEGRQRQAKDAATMAIVTAGDGRFHSGQLPLRRGRDTVMMLCFKVPCHWGRGRNKTFEVHTTKFWRVEIA
jgi:hypothetical protein